MITLKPVIDEKPEDGSEFLATSRVDSILSRINKGSKLLSLTLRQRTNDKGEQIGCMIAVFE